LKLIGLVLKKKYQILESIHENERFYSFRGIDVEDDSPVFIKIAKPSILKDRKKIGFFTEEVKSLAKIKHKGVVKVYDMDFENGILYVVSEWVQGRPLSEYIRSRHRFPFWKILQLITQLAHILEHAHSLGVKYRTVKHSNILITDSMEIKILSFNVPRSLLSPVPIKITENKGVDPDIYFLGVVLYELLTLKFPFKQEMFITDIQTLPKEMKDKRFEVPINDLEDPALKEAVDKLIYHSTTRKVLDRYKRIQDMLDDLKEYSKKRDERQIDKKKSGNDILNELNTLDKSFSRRFQREESIKRPEKKENKKGDIFKALDEVQENNYKKIGIYVLLIISLISALIYFIITLI